MSKLHLFNPENDLALAAGTANYTAPAAAMRLHRAAALLPLWYGGAGDCVYAPEAPESWVEQMRRRYGLQAEPGTAGSPSPWGWSANAVRQFRKIGHEGPFPDVEKYRQLSHRRTAALLHDRLAAAGLPYELPQRPAEISEIEKLPAGNDFYLKAPWSGSGRGVIDCTALPRKQIEAVAQGIINHQGSVMVEPRLDRIRDFAMLFRSDGHGMVEYCGLSLFFNAVASAYGGNIVAPQSTLNEMIGHEYLEVTARAVTTALCEILGNDYFGPLGVDMMTYLGGDGRAAICPTVEINLRMTMGFVALALERFAPSPKRFRIIPGATDVLPGAISLLPPNPDFTFLLSD